MGIILDNNNHRAHIFTKDTSYIIETFEGELIHSYWGKRIDIPNKSPLIPIETFCSFYQNPNKDNPTYSLEVIPREFPDFGRSDFRNPAVRLKTQDGSAISRFVVESFQLLEEKPALTGLPSTYEEDGDKTESLKIVLLDSKTGVRASLHYTVYEEFNAITRHVVYENTGDVSVFLETALSASVDFYNDNDFELINLHGSWAREREISRIPVGNSTHLIDSKRGSSSHTQNPFVMLARKNTDDLSGEVYAMNFVYSGSFKAMVEVNSMGTTRFQMGLNDFDFNWKLGSLESFTTPEVVMVYSDQGFNKMSQSFHHLYRKRVCRGAFRDVERPVLINNWEATYFGFTEDKLKAIGDAAKDIGIELFVLDDGWFGLRDSDKSGLGDWFVNKNKLKNGLDGVANHMNDNGLEFGLWFEPEMVSPDSDLYRKHPNWALHAKGHTRTEGRNQLVLDLSRRDVQDYLIEVVGDILRSHKITYVKWDMNRNMTEVNSEILPIDRQGEVTHRYMLGLYRVLRKLTDEFKDILFESCSGGGGRFDPGMLYYMPQTWTSDDTDAYERLFIQYGTSLAYPPITMGAHVSVAPNHQVGRYTILETRGFTSMMANLGYELDLSALSEGEAEEVGKQIAFYKSIRRDIQFGNFYRLLSPYGKKGTAFLTESEDQKRYYLFHFRGLNKPHKPKVTLPLTYLSDGDYTVKNISFTNVYKEIKDANGDLLEGFFGDSSSSEEDITYSADFLNRYGYTFGNQLHDFDGHLYIIEKIDN